MKKFLIALLVALSSPVLADPPDFSASAVEVIVGGGHGSGVYIGKGYILTAAHVAANVANGTVTIKRPRNADWIDEWTAKVLWIDTQHDFALLKLNAVAPDDLPAAKVACTEMTIGENVTVVGWPTDLGRIKSRGYVASEVDKRGPWEVSYVVIAPIFFGNSGGPVYNTEGRVVALAVGIIPGTSLAIVVPTSPVCPQLPAESK